MADEPQSPSVELALEHLRHSVDVGLERVAGQLALLLQRADQTDRRDDDQDKRIEALDQRLDGLDKSTVTKRGVYAFFGLIAALVAAGATVVGVLVGV